MAISRINSNMVGAGDVSNTEHGYLNSHVDFNWHHKLQLHRRVNVLIYLTPNFRKINGAQFELKNSNQEVDNENLIFDECWSITKFKDKPNHERLQLIIDNVLNSKYLQKDDLTIVVLDT